MVSGYKGKSCNYLTIRKLSMSYALKDYRNHIVQLCKERGLKNGDVVKIKDIVFEYVE